MIELAKIVCELTSNFRRSRMCNEGKLEITKFIIKKFSVALQSHKFIKHFMNLHIEASMDLKKN